MQPFWLPDLVRHPAQATKLDRIPGASSTMAPRSSMMPPGTCSLHLLAWLLCAVWPAQAVRTGFAAAALPHMVRHHHLP